MDQAEDILWDDTTINDWPESTPVKDFYKGKTVFLTGATGSVGRLILQKLIRLDVGKIYIHIRPKKGFTSFDRLQMLCKDVIMKLAAKHNPQYIDQLVLIEGDLSHPNLGICEREQDEIIRNTQIVLQVAADVRFDQALKPAVFNNVRSVYDLLKMSEKMRKLESFVFMSTAYSNNTLHGEETFYQLPIDPDTLIKFVENLDNETEEYIEQITQKVIQPWNNTYTYTKNIAEYLVLQYKDKMPVAIIRPSIIIATDKDPFPGWIDNVYGLNGVLIGFGTGILRVLYANKNYVGDVIPGDYVANSTLALAYFTHVDYKKESDLKAITDAPSLPIYSCVSSTDNPQKWKEVDQAKHFYRQYPSMKMVWYCTTNYESNLFLFKIFNLIYHCVPAFFIDNFLKWQGEKIRLMRVYRTIQKNIDTVKCFMKNWKFDNKNMRWIYDRMTESDHRVFPCDIRNLNWTDYNRKYFLGLRVFWAKDSLNTLPVARKRAFKLKIAHYTVRAIYLGVVYYIDYQLLKYFGVIDYIKSFDLFHWINK